MNKITWKYAAVLAAPLVVALVVMAAVEFGPVPMTTADLYVGSTQIGEVECTDTATDYCTVGSASTPWAKFLADGKATIGSNLATTGVTLDGTPNDCTWSCDQVNGYNQFATNVLVDNLAPGVSLRMTDLAAESGSHGLFAMSAADATVGSEDSQINYRVLKASTLTDAFAFGFTATSSYFARFVSSVGPSMTYPASGAGSLDMAVAGNSGYSLQCTTSPFTCPLFPTVDNVSDLGKAGSNDFKDLNIDGQVLFDNTANLYSSASNTLKTDDKFVVQNTGSEQFTVAYDATNYGTLGTASTGEVAFKSTMDFGTGTTPMFRWYADIGGTPVETMSLDQGGRLSIYRDPSGPGLQSVPALGTAESVSAIWTFAGGLKIGTNGNTITEALCGNASFDPASIATESSGTKTVAVTNLSANAACACSPRADFSDDLILKYCYATAGNLNIVLYNPHRVVPAAIDAGAQTVDYCCFEK